VFDRPFAISMESDRSFLVILSGEGTLTREYPAKTCREAVTWLLRAYKEKSESDMRRHE